MNSRSKAFSNNRRRPAFLLLLVLAFLFLTSVVVVSVLESSMRNLRSAATASARDDLRVYAFSAMEVSLATLAEIRELDENLHSPAQGWGNPIDYAPVAWPEGVKVTVEIKDETGKLPLDSPDRDMLHQLLEQLGVDFSESEELIDAYLDWVDEDDLERLNGAEADYYERQTPKRTPPNAPITSYDAFRYIKGFDELFFDENGAPNSLFKRFKDSTSLKHGHSVNINTASTTLVEMYEETQGFDARSLKDLKDGLDGVPGTEDDGWSTGSSSEDGFSTNENSGLGHEAHVFRITVRVSQGPKHFQLSALVDDGSDGREEGSGGGRGENGQEGEEGSGGDGEAVDGGSGGNSGGGGGNMSEVPDFGVIDDFAGGGSGRGGDNPRENDGEGDEESEEGEEGGRSGGGGTSVLYSTGDWRILELTENGTEDG